MLSVALIYPRTCFHIKISYFIDKFPFLFLQIILLSLIHISGSYNFENFRAKGFLCKTNIPSSTAIRGFGGPQSVFIIENIVNDVAVYLKKDKAQVNKSQAESRPPL